MRFSIHVAVAALALIACNGVHGSGTPKTETRNVPTFTEVDVAAGIEADLRTGPAGPVSVTADDNLMANVVTEVANGRLKVGMTGGNVSTSTRVHVVASAPSFTAVRASSGSTVHVAGLAGDALALEASSGATLTATGTSKSLATTASSGATLDASGVVAAAVTASASSGATLKVDATSAITGSTSSGASVHVRGAPKTRAVAESAGGSVSFD